MLLTPHKIATRDRLILAGLYLSKFDEKGYIALGFTDFTEAFNVLGYAFGGKPASIKNYRDEFDPLFPNPRKGWHKRKRRDYCLKFANDYGSLDLAQFATLIRSFLPEDYEVEGMVTSLSIEQEPEQSSFAKRLITGLAAERYFQQIQPSTDEFKDCEVEDATKYGCGYDFRLWPRHGGDYLVVEVKGIAEKSGYISLTSKEHHCAQALADRFFLFVVKNFSDSPFHEVHSNPLSGNLQFVRRERATVQVSWLASA